MLLTINYKTKFFIIILIVYMVFNIYFIEMINVQEPPGQNFIIYLRLAFILLSIIAELLAAGHIIYS